jgi:hypothetical protein
MLARLLIIGFLAALPAIATAQLSWTPTQQKWKKISVFGASPSSSPAPIGLADAVRGDKFDNTILVHAVISSVCKKDGCWMLTSDQGIVVRIIAKNHEFTVPASVVGKHVVLEGELTEKTFSEADERRFAEEAGKGKKDVEKITGERKEYVFEANGVRIYE